MHLKNSFAVTLFATVALLASSAFGQASFDQTNVEVITDLSPDLDGTFTTNRITLDFTGPLTGVQAWLELTSGDGLYQETAFGGDTAPASALFGPFPNVQWDSFVGNGGWDAGTTNGTPLLVGAAVNIGGAPGTRDFDNGLNLAWATPPGNAPADEDNYPVAQLTFANNTQGTLHLFASAGGQFLGPITVPVINGVVGAGVIIPEPSTIVLLGVAFAGLIALKRRNG